MHSTVAARTLACAIVLATAGCANGLAPKPPAPLFHTGLTAPAGAYGVRALPTAPHLLGAPFLDADSGPARMNSQPVLAYDSQDDSYLAAWRNVSDGSLHGRIKDAHGQTLVPDFRIAAAGLFKDNGKAVYLPWLNQFAVVYETPYQMPWGIFLQRISSAGALVGAPVPVSLAPGEPSGPDLAVDAIHHRVEVVWSDQRSGDADVYGRLLSFNGNQTAMLTNETLIGNSPPDPGNGYQSANQSAPTIDFGSKQQRYVVAWQDQRDELADGDDIWGRALDANGQAATDQYVISNFEGDQIEPSIAYLAASDKFLLAFTSENNGVDDADLLAAGLDGDGSVLGWGVIANPLGRQHAPNVAANNASMTWLVGYANDFDHQEAAGNTRLMGRHVGWAFQLGDAFDIGPMTSVFDAYLGIAANTDDQEFLVDYVQSCTAPASQTCSSSDIYGQRIDRGY